MAQNAWTGLSQATAGLPALGMGMMQMKQNQDNRDAALAIARERAGAQQTHYNAMETNANRVAAAAEAKVPKHQQIAHPSGLAPAKLATQRQFGKAGMEALDPVWSTYSDIAGSAPNTTMGDVYAAAKSAWPTMREEIAANIQKSLESGKLSPTESKRMSALYDAVMYDQTGDKVLGEGIFKNTARSIKMEDENSKSALLAEREAGKNERAQMTDARVRELAEENMALKRDRESRLGSPKPEKTKPPKPPSTTDIARVKKMIQEAGSDPSADDITLIQEAANAIGYDYVNVPGGKRGIPGIDAGWANWKDKDTWKLVPKSGSATYKTADEVKADYQAGKISEAEATKILQGQFGYK